MRVRRPGLVLAGLALAALSCGTESPTFAVVDNAYPAPPDGGSGPQAVVYRGWWSVTYFATPVPAGAESAENRVIPSTDYAYALLAPGWDPDSGAPPATLLPLRTNDRLSVGRGGTLHVVLSDATAAGNCAAGKPLPQDVADLITRSIFPDEFSGVAYDAATCRIHALDDAGSDASPDDEGADGGDGLPLDASLDVPMPD